MRSNPESSGRAAFDQFLSRPSASAECYRAGAYLLGRFPDGGPLGPPGNVAADTDRYLERVVALSRGPGGLGAVLPESLGVLAALVAQAESVPEDPQSGRGGDALSLRRSAAGAFGALTEEVTLHGIQEGLSKLVFPLISGTIARPYSQRVNDVCAAFDRILDLQHWTEDESLREVVRRTYSYKFARFGTSGIRGVWGTDFTTHRIRCIARAIAESIRERSKAAPPSVVVGYDSRLHADELGAEVADVFLNDGFVVHLSSRDSPTPAINYYGTIALEGQTDGIITCTSSHNPVDWHGVKFTEPTGQPAPTSRTNWIGARATQLLFEVRSGRSPVRPPLSPHESLREFDPLDPYCRWLFSKQGKNRLDTEAIRAWLGDKLVVVDEMHGAGRGYLPHLLRTLGVPFVTVHGARDPKLGRLHYPLPEAPDLAECQEATRLLGAVVGVAMDGDADRFGVVDGSGEILPQNQVLTLLVEHMLRMGRSGRVIRGFPTMMAIDDVLRTFAAPGQVSSPDPSSIPAYARSSSYVVSRGQLSDLAGSPAFVTSVGMKYLAEAAQMDPDYSLRPGGAGSPGPILIAGEDNGGLTTGEHLFDKDGIWADLLVLEMISVRRQSLLSLWGELESKLGATWQYRRLDLDGMEEAKQRLVNYFLLEFPTEPDPRMAGLRCEFAGGLRGEMVEVRLSGERGIRGRVIIRSSGTESVCRIYSECTDPGTRRSIERAVLGKMDEYCLELVTQAQDPRILVETLLVTPTLPRTIRQVEQTIEGFAAKHGADVRAGVHRDLSRRIPTLDTRRRASAERWISILG